MEHGNFIIENSANVEVLLHTDYEEIGIKDRKAVIVCPGGGYGFLSEREGEPIALKFFGEGFNVFILKYSICEGAANFNPLCELLLTVKHIRENSEKYRVIKNRIFVIGFSAGAHLAASSATLYDIPEIEERVGPDREICRPDGTILCYPVIDGGEYAHKGSIQNVAGATELTQEDIDLFSLQKHVKATTPPAFLWHTANDGLVPSENTLIYALALRKFKIPCEVHIYPCGNHGLALCNRETFSGIESHKNPYVAGWIDLALNWANKFPEFL